MSEKPWKHTLGADWSGHSIATRRNVEELLESLTNPVTYEAVADPDAPIARFLASRTDRGRLGRRRRRAREAKKRL